MVLLRRHVGRLTSVEMLRLVIATGHVGRVRMLMHVIGLVWVIGVDVFWHRANLPLLHGDGLYGALKARVRSDRESSSVSGGRVSLQSTRCSSTIESS